MADSYSCRSNLFWGFGCCLLDIKMKIALIRKGENIVAIKDYSDINQKGEVAHMIAELELIKLDLLEIWDNINKVGEEE